MAYVFMDCLLMAYTVIYTYDPYSCGLYTCGICSYGTVAFFSPLFSPNSPESAAIICSLRCLRAFLTLHSSPCQSVCSSMCMQHNITRALPAPVSGQRSLAWKQEILFSKASLTAHHVLLTLGSSSASAFHRPATHPCRRTKTFRSFEQHCSGASRFRSETPPGICPPPKKK